MTAATADVTALVEHVAATVVRPRFRALVAGDVAEKTPGDVVTVVDQAAEVALAAGLRELDPGAVVVGEEAVAADPSLLDALAVVDRAYLVDPIDGTQAFVDGEGEYAVMVSRVERGEAVATWVCLPEGEGTFVAERGSGAWLGDRRLTGPRTPDAVGELSGGVAEFYATPEQRAALAGVEFGPRVRRGGRLWSGYYYTRMALGRADFLFYSRTHPWDHAPGAVLSRELGGAARTLDGRDYRPVGVGTALLVAASTESWDLVARVLPQDAFPRGG